MVLSSDILFLNHHFLSVYFAFTDSKPNQNDLKRENDGSKSKGNKSLKKSSIFKTDFDGRFAAAEPLEYTQLSIKRLKKMNEAERTKINFKLAFNTDEGSLPDHFMANLRMLVVVWEAGLDSITNESVMLLNLAIRDFIKNILMAVLTFKSSFHTYGNAELKYAVGVPTLNPYLRNSHSLYKYSQDVNSSFAHDDNEYTTQSKETKEYVSNNNWTYSKFNSRIKDYSEGSENLNTINLWQLFHALKLHKSTIQSHSVYAINMEKIITKLSHRVNNEDL